MTCDSVPCVDVPEGQCGNWRVERFTVTAEDVMLHNLRCAFKPGMGRRAIQAGTYTKLMHGHFLVMSDTSAEKLDHRCAVRAARGVILLNGLGLGMVLNACLIKPDVESAIVVERSPEVISLVGMHYLQKFPGPLEIVEADAMTFKPPAEIRFGMVWHDIWSDICADNLPEMKTLHRRYGRRADWQGSWSRKLCQASQ